MCGGKREKILNHRRFRKKRVCLPAAKAADCTLDIEISDKGL